MYRSNLFHSFDNDNGSWRCKPSDEYFDSKVHDEYVWENVDKETQYYFDAEEEALKEDEYPIFFTTTLQHPKPIVSSTGTIPSWKTNYSLQ
jgi:hypothetical protein